MSKNTHTSISSYIQTVENKLTFKNLERSQRKNTYYIYRASVTKASKNIVK